MTHPFTGKRCIRKYQPVNFQQINLTMFHYVLKRIAVMIPTLVVISFIIFVIIQLPPGDYLETYIAELESQGESVDKEKIEFLRRQYGLDQPFLVQYYNWTSGFFVGDWGYSFEHDLPVREVVGDRILLTIFGVGGNHHFHLGDRLSHRHLFGDASI